MESNEARRSKDALPAIIEDVLGSQNRTGLRTTRFGQYTHQQTETETTFHFGGHPNVLGFANEQCYSIRKRSQILRSLAICPVVVGFLYRSPNNAATFNQDVAWSPDSRWISYSALQAGQNDVFVVPAAGGVPKKINASLKGATWTTWSSDSKSLAFSAQGPKNHSEIYLVAIDAPQQSKMLTDSSGRDFQPAWSPAAKRMAFVSNRTGSYQIWTMAGDGTDQRQITFLEMNAETPQWSRDGKHIVFYMDSGNHKDQIAVVDSDGSHFTKVTDDQANNIYPGWTPKGDIVFASNSRLMIVKPGQAARSFLNVETFFARVSPDGKQITYIVGKYPSTHIEICRIDGSQCHAVPEPE